jgi:hypothetical protein
MRSRFLATIGVLALVSYALTGCAQQVKPDGFIDKTGKLVVDPTKTTQKPLVFGDYSEGFVPAKFESGYGCLDKDGGLAFVHPFKYIAPFSDGMAAFAVGKSADQEMWGYINNTGETMIEPTYGAAGQFSEGVAPVRMHKDDKGAKAPGKWCYIDKTGKRVLDKYFDEADSFIDGLAAVRINGKVGCINKAGKFIVPAKYDKVYPVSAGIIVAAEGDGISEDNRDQTLEFFDVGGTNFTHKTMTPVPLKNLRHHIWIRNEYKGGDAAAEDERKLRRPLSGDSTPGFHEGLGIMQEGKKFSHMTPKFVRPGYSNVYDYIFPFSEGMALVYDDNGGGKFGYLDTTENLMIPYRFWDASPFRNGVALVQETKDGLYGYIDKKGKYILPPIYESARPFKDDRALVGKSALTQPEP